MVGVERKDPIDGLTLFVGNAAQRIRHMDPSDHQDLAVLFDLAYDRSDECPTACIDVTRLQRASEGTGQSAPCRGDEVVDCRCVRRERVLVNAIVLRDLAVNTEADGIRATRHVRCPQRAVITCDG